MSGQKNKRPAENIPEQLIREQLEAILAHDIFTKSERICDLLRFVVNEALQGKADAIKEQVILCEVFGAGDGPAFNTVVRTTARRLREKLREFYDDNSGNRVLIALPKGSYVPAFELLRTGSADSPLKGNWKATVVYENPYMTFPRYETRDETLTFELDGDELHGTATFHGNKKALIDGRVDGDRVSFITRQFAGSSNGGEMTARYRGKISKDEIHFVLVLEGSRYSGEPLEFTAVRRLEGK